MSVRRRAGVMVVAALASVAALLCCTGASAASVTCPVATTSASTGAVQWAFSEYGAPTPSSSLLGKGTWNDGHATGKVCTVNKGGGLPARRLVLSMTGTSRVLPHITKYGLLGVGMVLPVTVSASDDAACPRGTNGSVTLFASYYSVHRDSIVLHFASACASHDHTFTGSIVHVLIARNGAQVNTASLRTRA